MSIVKRILAGERDPRQLAALRDGRCKESEATIALALQGTWRPEHLFALQRAYELYRFHHRQVTECDQRIAAELASLPDRAGDKAAVKRPRQRGRKSNDVRFDATGAPFRAIGLKTCCKTDTVSQLSPVFRHVPLA